jgi:hypothetical protein
MNFTMSLTCEITSQSSSSRYAELVQPGAAHSLSSLVTISKIVLAQASPRLIVSGALDAVGPDCQWCRIP